MIDLITTFRSQFKFFKQPRKIGDVFEQNETHWLVIGIEKFEITRGTLIIWYTCQNLTNNDYLYFKKHSEQNNSEVELELQFKYDDTNWEFFMPGRVVSTKSDGYFKVVEYTEVSLKSTDVYVSAIAKPVFPVNRKEAKARLVHEKRKKLKLEVY